MIILLVNLCNKSFAVVNWACCMRTPLHAGFWYCVFILLFMASCRCPIGFMLSLNRFCFNGYSEHSTWWISGKQWGGPPAWIKYAHPTMWWEASDVQHEEVHSVVAWHWPLLLWVECSTYWKMHTPFGGDDWSVLNSVYHSPSSVLYKLPTGVNVMLKITVHSDVDYVSMHLYWCRCHNISNLWYPVFLV